MKRISSGRPADASRFTLHASRVGLLLFGALLLSGCVRRSLTIRTQPPGAMVYLNDRLIGETPVTFDFTWYGWHRVILRKDGFERIEDRKELRAPIALWIPFDLAMELLPFPIRDARTWSYTLNPVSTPLAPKPPELILPTTKAPAPAPPTSPGPEGETAMTPTAAPSQPTANITSPPATPESPDEPR